MKAARNSAVAVSRVQKRWRFWRTRTLKIQQLTQGSDWSRIRRIRPTGSGGSARILKLPDRIQARAARARWKTPKIV